MTERPSKEAENVLIEELLKQAASLQPQVDSISSQVFLLAIAVFGLAMVTTMLGVRAWRA